MGVNIHASCILLGQAGAGFKAPAEAGILLLGASGSGKSDLALRLIAAGAELVADDRTELEIEDGALVAGPPHALAGLMEVRNLGIVALPPRPKARIALVVDLGPDGPPVRLPEPERWTGPPGLALPGAACPPSRPPRCATDGRRRSSSPAGRCRCTSRARRSSTPRSSS